MLKTGKKNEKKNEKKKKKKKKKGRAKVALVFSRPHMLARQHPSRYHSRRYYSPQGSISTKAAREMITP